MTLPLPSSIILLSGKRKSGKDFVAGGIEKVLGTGKCSILRLSNAIKKEYAELKGVNYQELLTDGPYKELYRREMIALGEDRRSKDPGHYCRLACQAAPPGQVWIVTDTRRESDIKWFRETYTVPILTVRVEAPLDVRSQRGWVWTDGVKAVSVDMFPHTRKFEAVMHFRRDPPSIETSTNPETPTTTGIEAQLSSETTPSLILTASFNTFQFRK
eukprot:sb/3470019/